ncbi:class I adenylate-forming enzyme family protein [uncultured Tessaracoccus sp.]|uniref:AMP-binding protein n=1 Tax=uncultured Tessaracoccus sp. TaxID=905023 RepID=UPI0025D04D72|nr:class I adenylate-forming enzyme family protein [uncultured Tessaracoccus sp.]
MIEELLQDLRARPDALVFLGRDRITRAEFADLVWTFAGGLRARNPRNVALVARPGPATLAFALAAVGMGVRLDLVDPRGGTELVQGRLEAAVPDVVVAEPWLRFALKGPGWLRRPLGLPDWRIWPEVVAIDDVGGAQVRRFALTPEQSALCVFTSGTTDDPTGVVHSLASLDAGFGMVASLFDAHAEGPVVADTFFAMLPAIALGLPVLRPASRPAALAKQLRRWRPSHTYLTPPRWRALLAAGGTVTGRTFAGSAPVTAELLGRLRGAGASEAWGVYAMTEVFPVAAVESSNKDADDPLGDHAGRLFDGVEARVEGDELILAGTSMAPRRVDGSWVDEVPTGDLAHLDGRELWLRGRTKDMILQGATNIYPGLYEPRLTLDGVDVALLLGIPGEDADERLVLLAQPTGAPGDLERRLIRRARELGLRLDAVVLDEVPTSGRSDKPDRAAARALVQERLA